MKFEEVLPALREGKKVRVKHWVDGAFIVYNNFKFIDENGADFTFSPKGLVGVDSWEIYEEPKKKKLYAYTSRIMGTHANSFDAIMKDFVIEFIGTEIKYLKDIDMLSFRSGDKEWERSPQYDLEF